MNTDFHVIIPARYQSTRLPGKLLMDLNGQTVIERVYHQALKSKASSVTIATDHADIFDAAKKFGAQVVMTSDTHQSGTDRLAEVVQTLGFYPQDIIVNVQGDEPLIAPALISQVAACLENTDVPVASLCWPISDYAMCTNPNIVKVVRDSQQNALYFSRSAIPANRDNPTDIQNIFRHIGLYAYRAAFLLDIVKWPVCPIESMEALEQLRVLWAGYKIKVDEACVLPMQDINTAEDLVNVRMLLSK